MSTKKGENEKTHNILDYGCAKDDGDFLGTHLARIRQCTSRNGNARCSKSAAEEASGFPEKAEHVGDTGAENERPDHTGKGDEECGGARLTHAVNIRLNACNEHQQPAHLSENQ